MEEKVKPVVDGAANRIKLRAARNDKKSKDHPVVVPRASQMGTAAEVAKNIRSSIEGMGLASHVVPMNEMGFYLTKEQMPHIICVTSSTGDNEAPDNATTFYNDV